LAFSSPGFWGAGLFVEAGLRGEQGFSGQLVIEVWSWHLILGIGTGVAAPDLLGHFRFLFQVTERVGNLESAQQIAYCVFSKQKYFIPNYKKLPFYQCFSCKWSSR
jgi:hypothetical protein